MCKHVAAVFYGIGARLDDRPELLFQLRKVDEKDLIARAGGGLPLSKRGPGAEKVLATDDLAQMFGLELGDAEGAAVPGSAPARVKAPGKTRVTIKAKAKPKVRTSVRREVRTIVKASAKAATAHATARRKRSVKKPAKNVAKPARSHGEQ